MTRFGLPTYPIYSSMVIGARSPDEIEWLLDHGYFQSDIRQFAQIIKVDGTYQLHRVDQWSEPNTDETIMTADSLNKIVKAKKIDISYWRWFEQA